jgi:hypothetical protein
VEKSRRPEKMQNRCAIECLVEPKGKTRRYSDEHQWAESTEAPHSQQGIDQIERHDKPRGNTQKKHPCDHTNEIEFKPRRLLLYSVEANVPQNEE